MPSCEFFPLVAVRTNVIGCDNVLESAIRAGVKKVIVLSNDKAGTRYGNVMASRGSVISK